MARARPSLILGNWKMHRTAGEAAALVRDCLPRLAPTRTRDIAIAPPFTALHAVASVLAGSQVRLAAQNIFWETEGPYTGEISPLMLQELGVAHVIVGHSERRLHLGETDHMVNRKAIAALRSNLAPVVCVGESEAEREAGRAVPVVREQVLRGLEGIAEGDAARVAVAYEPIWAIGTGRAATPSDIAEMHEGIRAALRSSFGPVGERPRILYGGSVTPANIDALMARPEVDGVLVGGASLRAGDFVRICNYR